MIYSIYTIKFVIFIRKINISLETIDVFYFNSFTIVIADYSIQNIIEMVWFFHETFLLANISWEIIL